MKNILLLTGLLLLSACGSKAYYEYPDLRGDDGFNSLVDVSRGVFSNCEGVIINSGMDTNRNLVLDSAEIQSTGFVCDGDDGIDGTVVATLDPCGDGPGHDEVILVLDSGVYLAWLKNVGLVELIEGVSYQTTDSQKCNFRIENGSLL